MQPHPLRDDVFRLQTEGEFVKNAHDVIGNVVKLTRIAHIQNQIESEVPGYKLPRIPKKERKQTKGLFKDQTGISSILHLHGDFQIPNDDH
jgi:hypothetical protein